MARFKVGDRVKRERDGMEGIVEGVLENLIDKTKGKGQGHINIIEVRFDDGTEKDVREDELIKVRKSD